MALNGITSVVITDGTTKATAVGYSYWAVGTERNMNYLYTAECDPTDTDAEILSPGIPGELINGRKITVGIKIGTAGANVAPGMSLEGSYDGKNWALVNSELSADLTPDVAQTLTFASDLTNYAFPWYRISMNDDVTEMTTIKFNFYIGGIDNSRFTWVAAGTSVTVGAPTLIGGNIGKDPS